MKRYKLLVDVVASDICIAGMYGYRYNDVIAPVDSKVFATADIPQTSWWGVEVTGFAYIPFARGYIPSTFLEEEKNDDA